MNEATATDPQAEPASEPQTAKFASIEETAAKIAEITKAPPSPMPIPGAAASTPDSTAVESKPSEAAPQSRLNPKEFEGLKDYKNRPFDPRLHKVKANGEPELTAEGKLKLLPPSKRGGIVDTVRQVFNRPKSDHELTAEQEETARAQARSISQIEEMEAGAEFYADSYFLLGNTVAGAGFSNTKEQRYAAIRQLFLNYEKKTGKAFDPPAGLALIVGVSMDFVSTVTSEPECRERLDVIKESVVSAGVKGAVRRSWLGKALSVFGIGRSRPAPQKTEPAKRETPERESEIPSHLQAVQS